MQKEEQVSFLAEKIRQADAVLIGGGSGLSSAAGYNHYHWLAKKPRPTFDNSPALPESLPDFNGCPSVNHIRISVLLRSVYSFISCSLFLWLHV